jgi:5-methylcytosine-specific restriction endonuclease McrA
MSRSWQKGSTRAWRRIRARVLARDQYQCQLRLQGCTGAATQAHHVLGRAVTGDDMAHLVAACAQCNRKVGDPTKASPQPRRVSRW